jgi:hypothetical protein
MGSKGEGYSHLAGEPISLCNGELGEHVNIRAGKGRRTYQKTKGTFRALQDLKPIEQLP